MPKDAFPPAHLRKIYITRERHGWRIRWCRHGSDGMREFPDEFACSTCTLDGLLHTAMQDIERVCELGDRA